MNLNDICYGCMKEKNGIQGRCPHCGFDPAVDFNKNGQLYIGTILNNSYMVGKSLGDGGFGITYIGFDMNLYKKVAIKEFFMAGYCVRYSNSNMVAPCEGKKGQLFLKEKNRFVEEGRILAQIDEQPGVVKVINYFEENGTAYIVMEYLEGVSLKSYIASRGGTVPVEEAMGLMQPVIKALSAIHEKGIVHRDISPDNIMITNSGKIKLIDFGAAKSKEMDMSSDKVYKKTYSPIEQRTLDGVVGTYSDIYALCATIYEIITGIKIPPANERAVRDVVNPPSYMGVQIHPVWEAAVINGIAVSPDDRIKNATDLYFFLYIYAMDAGATPEGLKKKVQESATKVILKNMQKERYRRKKKSHMMIAVVMIFALGCLIIAVRTLGGKIDEKNDKPVMISESGEEKEAISEADLEGYVEEFYKKVQEEREKKGLGEFSVNSSYEGVAKQCVSELVTTNLSTTDEWNKKITDCVNLALTDNNLSGIGWLVIPYTKDFTIDVLYADACRQIDNINASANGKINLDNCTQLGISVGVHSDGTIFWVIFYK